MNNNVQIGGHTGAALGVVVRTDNTATTGKFYAIQVLEAASFSAFTENGKTGNVMTGFSIPAGTIIYNGLGITAFTLESGKVRAYNMRAE